MSSTYKFYMQAVDKNGQPLSGAPLKDLEVDFLGLKYRECKGLETIGAPQNIYTESYADSDKLRTYVPLVITNKPTTVTLSLYFTGEDRYKSYDEFNAYLRSSSYFMYYDTARYRKLVFFVKNEISVSDTRWYGSMPYIEVNYKLSNIFGKTENINQ